MAGFIQAAQNPNAAAPAQTPSKPSTNISDPLLKKTKLNVEVKINPQIKDQYLRIEVAGMAILTTGNMPQLVLKKIQSNPDVSSVVSDGVANTIAMIYNEASKNMPKPQLQQFNAQFVAAAPTASIALMCQVLDMAEQALQTKITPDLVAQCSQQCAQKVLMKLHVTSQQIQQVVAAGQQAKGK